MILSSSGCCLLDQIQQTSPGLEIDGIKDNISLRVTNQSNDEEKDT
jgi:hypothetical protein